MPLAQPKLNAIAFAVKSNLKNIIPDTTNVRGAASFEMGFPQETMVKKVAGGIPPSGYDFNGVFNQLSQHQVWLNAGGKYKFNAELANAIGGYHLGAQLVSDDGLRLYVSTIDGNKNNLNHDVTGWALIATSELESLLNAEEDDRIISDNLLNQKIDLKYDKTGGVVSGDVHVNGILGINTDSPNGGVIIRPNSLNNGADTQITAISGDRIDSYYFDKPVRAPTSVGGDWVTLTGDQAFGTTQMWRDLTPNRASHTTYTNSKPYPIEFCIYLEASGNNAVVTVFADGVFLYSLSNTTAWGTSRACTVIVPPRSTYRVEGNFTRWSELF
ncbi:hypothetical protein [Acinetobacter guillouiae]|uniref:hypothetical protein n=1 Tax=Acinetobacter guillouiae TaxID=106649 RepID=UPI0032B372D0